MRSVEQAIRVAARTPGERAKARPAPWKWRAPGARHQAHWPGPGTVARVDVRPGGGAPAAARRSSAPVSRSWANHGSDSRAVHDAIRTVRPGRLHTQIRQAEARPSGRGERHGGGLYATSCRSLLESAGRFLAPAVHPVGRPPPARRGQEADLRSCCRGVVAAMVRMDLTRKLGESPRSTFTPVERGGPRVLRAFRSLMTGLRTKLHRRD